MKALFTELKRRKVFRVAVVYLATAFVILQAADIMLPRLGVPEWAMSLMVVVVVLGFPLALVLAWALELTPDGVRVTPSTAKPDPSQPVPSLLGKRTVFAAGALVVLGVGLGAGLFLRPMATPADGVREASIAVLPFVDMSADADQQYFGDGLSEEILNLLAGIRELKVSGRTSSFSFKGTNTSIPEIGRTLGVAHVLEGSVRRAGDQLRITAQLVETESGFHLWSETYDRSFQDVFAIQDEIAGAIASALRLTLGGRSTDGASDLEAYDLYLRARTLIYGRTVAGLREARVLIDRALALDPDFPPALAASGELWLLLSDSQSSYGDIPEDQANASARAVLQRALALDPDLADAHAAMGLLFITLNDFTSAQAYLDRALAINPSLTNANHWQGLGFARSGQMRRAVESSRRFAELDPLFLPNLSNMVGELAIMGEFEEAERLARRIQRSHPDHPQPNFGNALRLEGRLADAAEFLERLRSSGDDRALSRLFLELTYSGLGEHTRALELSGGWSDVHPSIALDREDEGLARAWARLEESPGSAPARWGLLHGLSLAGRHQELLDWVSGSWLGPEELDASLPYDFSSGLTLAPLAAAQRATGRDADLAATLAYWGDVLAFLEESGFAHSGFVFTQASFLALSGERDRAFEKLAEAIDRGHRDPLLGRTPAFEPWWGDARFVALVERNLSLIDAERAKLGLEPL
jgi:TolB-like protein/tetratricopeptide (TPR) repeat protein